MIGLGFLFVIFVWFFVVGSLSAIFCRNVSPEKLRVTMQLLLFPILFVAPLSDEIIGRFQFVALCEMPKKFVFDEEEIRGKTLVFGEISSPKVSGTILPIKKYVSEWINPDTGEVLLTYRAYNSEGGWLSRSINFNNVRVPYTFDGACGVKNEIAELKAKFNVKLDYRRKRDG